MKKAVACILLVTGILSASSVFAAGYTDPDTVLMVQQALNSIGYDCGTPDGNAGNKTISAIKEYQFAKGLTPTGDIDDYLLAALEHDDIGATTNGGYKYDLLDDGTAIITQLGNCETRSVS